MSASFYDRLKPHIGHEIVCVSYGDEKNPDNVAIECETCCEVLVDVSWSLDDQRSIPPLPEFMRRNLP